MPESINRNRYSWAVKIVSITLLGLLLGACSESDTQEQATSTISGRVVDDPVSQATVSIYAEDGTTLIGTTTSQSDGSYSTNLPAVYEFSSYVISVEGGQINGVDFTGEMRAICLVDSIETCHITPYTTLLASLAEQFSGDSPSRLQQAATHIQETLGVASDPFMREEEGEIVTDVDLPAWRLSIENGAALESWIEVLQVDLNDGYLDTIPETKIFQQVKFRPDTTAPVITLSGNTTINLEQGTAYTEAGATATDAVDGVITVTTTGTFDTNTIGTYTVTYTATDKSNNMATTERQVVVSAPADTTAPIITLTGNATINLTQGTSYTEAGATATDAVDGVITVITTGTVNSNTVDTYTITYTATDASNNIATAERLVNVVVVPIPITPADTTAPIITLTGNATINLEQGTAYTEAGATATDVVDGAITVIITGTVDTNTVGTYTVTYTATDKSNNIATVVRQVGVVRAESTSETEAQVGVFVDSPVEGIEYRSLSYSGITNDKGEYLYKEGEIVSFYIGNIYLGKALATGILTPIEITDSAVPETIESVNLLVLLQSLDSDGDPDNGITITEKMRGIAIDLNLDIYSEETFNSDIRSIVRALKEDEFAEPVKDNDAITHFLAQQEILIADNEGYCSVKKDYASIFGSATDNCEERSYRHTFLYSVEPWFVAAEIMLNKHNNGLVDSSLIERKTFEMMLNVDTIIAVSTGTPKTVIKEGAKIASGQLIAQLFPSGNGEFASIINNTLWAYGDAASCVSGDTEACADVLKNSLDQAYKTFTDFRYSYLLNSGIERLNETRIAREYMKQLTTAGLSLNKLSDQLGISSITIKDQVKAIALTMDCRFNKICVDEFFSEDYEINKVIFKINAANEVMIENNTSLLTEMTKKHSDAWLAGVVFDQYSTMRSDIATNSAILAALAYETPRAIALFLESHQLKFEAMVGDSYLSSEGFLASQELNGEKHYILSLRGTDSDLSKFKEIKEDVATDFNISPIASLEVRGASLNFTGEELHTGFAKYAQLSLNSINKDIFESIRDKPDVDLTIVGHSLGGAAAQVTGLMLSKLFVAHDKFQIYTIAAPAVTKKKPDAYNRIRAFGFEEYQDIVPVVTLATGYKHISTRFLFGIKNYTNQFLSANTENTLFWDSVISTFQPGGIKLLSDLVDSFNYFISTADKTFIPEKNIDILGQYFYGVVGDGYFWDTAGTRNGVNHSSIGVYVPFLAEFSKSEEGLKYNEESLLTFKNSAPYSLPWIEHNYSVDSNESLLLLNSGFTGLFNGILDKDGDRLTITGVSLVNSSEGSIVNVNEGEWLFTPAEGVTGAVSFIYGVGDGIVTSTHTGSIEVNRVIVDTVPPIIFLNGDANITLTQGTSYAELGATAIDLLDGERVVTITGTVDENTVGQYTITYTAIDSAGNEETAERIVTIDMLSSMYSIVGSLNTEGRARSVAVSGNYAYLTSTPHFDSDLVGFEVIDISSPKAPEIVGSLDTIGAAISVALSGNYAYILELKELSTSANAYLRVVDISDPSAPEIIGSLAGLINPTAVEVIGSYAYITDFFSGLHIIDISIPEVPVRISSLSTPGHSRSISIIGDYAYVATESTGVQIINISNRSTPVILKKLDTIEPLGSVRYVKVLGENLYVSGYNSDGEAQVKIFDISIPNNPSIVGFIVGAEETFDIKINGKYAYLAVANFGVQIVDISTLSNPTIVDIVKTPNDARSIGLYGNYIYVTNLDSGLQIIGVSEGQESFGSSKLNDTGTTWSGSYPSGNNTTCVGTEVDKQDCSHGRDAQAAAGTLTKIGAGAAGFDFTKLDSSGNTLPASASSWSCVKDNHTGLIWEVKTTDGGIHDKNNTYRWGGLTAQGRDHASKEGTYYDDWNTLVEGSNSNNFCGFSAGWRVPRIAELISIVNIGSINPSIDTDYFPNTIGFVVWSSTPIAGYSVSAWFIDFSSGHSYYSYNHHHDSAEYVRLVH